MYWLSPVMQVVSAVLQVYMVLLVIRIVLTWVSMDQGHPVLRVLHAVSDPYLDWFRRFRILVVGNLDFSPLAALVVVNFFASLARALGTEGQITVGSALAILVLLLWGAVSFFLLLLGILAVVRFLGIQFRWGGPLLWSYLDALLQPAAYAVGRRLRPKTFLSYTTTLILLAVVTLGTWILGEIGFRLLALVLHGLPL